MSRLRLAGAMPVEKRAEPVEFSIVVQALQRAPDFFQRGGEEAEKARIAFLALDEDEAARILQFSLDGDEVEFAPERRAIGRRAAGETRKLVESCVDEALIEILIAVVQK